MCGEWTLTQRCPCKSKLESHCQSRWIVDASGDESGHFSMMANAQGVWHIECVNDI